MLVSRRPRETGNAVPSDSSPFSGVLWQKGSRETLSATIIPVSGSIDSYLWDRSHIKLS